jgi:hypothetical protein
MSRLIRSIKEHFRGRAGSSEGSNERRIAPRLKEKRDMRLLFSLTVQEARGAGSMLPMVLQGHTHDISRTGLALVLPSLRSGERDLTRGDRPLLMELELPSGPIRFQASPVRFEETARGEEEGALLGVHITSISESARSRLDQFLHEAQRRRPLSGELSPQDKKGGMK